MHFTYILTHNKYNQYSIFIKSGVPWLLTSAYFALFTGCEIGKDGWGSIRFGGGRGEGDGKKEVDAENKAEDVTSPLELAEPIDPKKIWNKYQISQSFF